MATSSETFSDNGVVNAVRSPELLAPAGTWECAKAAVENGAEHRNNNSQSKRKTSLATNKLLT